jgi:hypothetical protein
MCSSAQSAETGFALFSRGWTAVQSAPLAIFVRPPGEDGEEELPHGVWGYLDTEADSEGTPVGRPVPPTAEDADSH